MILLLFLAAIWLFWEWWNRKTFLNSTYHQVTHNGYYQTKRDLGKWGEYHIYNKLRFLEQQGARFLFNVYIPKKDGTTSEVDVIMICRYGLFVFESKNYSGWIFGKESQNMWMQTLPSGKGRSHKERFYNPILQNKTHIKHLNMALGRAVPMWSIITFSERCTLKQIEVASPDVFVVKRYDVPSLVGDIVRANEKVLTEEDVSNIYNRLYPLTQVSWETKLNHINNINQKHY